MQQLQYLTMNSILEGVGSSQVVRYLELLCKTWDITLITFEKEPISSEQFKCIEQLGIKWKPLTFGRVGRVGGLVRMIRLFSLIEKRKLIHARGDYTAFVAILRGSRKVIWDCRAILSDQRREVDSKSKFSLDYVFHRFIEYVCAKKSNAIIAITHRAVSLMRTRYNLPSGKFLMVSTSVDLERFKPNSNSKHLKKRQDLIKVLFSGTFGRQYDFHLMSAIIESLRTRLPVQTCVALSKGHDEGYKFLKPDEVVHLDQSDMPNLINSYDMGMSIWREELSTSLSSVAATKNAEFLACGKPILVNHNQGDIGNLVKTHKTGVSTQGRSTLDIERYVEELILLLGDDELEQRCRKLAEVHYSLGKGVTEISLLYQRIALEK